MRNYHIVSVSEPLSNISGYQKITANNLDEIVNHSADNLLCSCLEYVDKDHLRNIILDSLTKLKPNGQIVISFTNFKKIFEDFLNSKLPSSQIFDVLRGKNNIIILEDILALIDINTFKLMNVNYNEYNITITIERIII
jgi:hypothetical protein